jgi:hypothetical protein
MKNGIALLLWVNLLSGVGLAASKPHVVAFGKWTTIKVEDDKGVSADVKIRPLYVDGRTKEFTVGPAHDVTDRRFVVQHMYRLNDSLPQESGIPRWRWERGGWLLVDRISGKIQRLALPEFDADFSAVNWFRDYAAYCGASDDGEKSYAMIVQLDKRKPLMKKGLGGELESSLCPLPVWQRSPVRVTFSSKPDQNFAFTVKGKTVDWATEDTNEGEE